MNPAPAPGASLASVLEPVFEANFRHRDEVGASLSVWKDGSELAVLHHGYRNRARTIPWDAATCVPFWSATKGLSATAALLAVYEAGLEPSDPLAAFWPELGLGELKIGQLLGTVSAGLSHGRKLDQITRTLALHFA